MFRQMNWLTKPHEIAKPQTGLFPGGTDRETIAGRIGRLHALARKSLWRLLLFVTVSLAAIPLREFDLLGSVSDGTAAFLGAPPPTVLIHLVLGISSVCAVILIPFRIGEDLRRGHSWTQFWVTVSFYPLYAMGNVLALYYPLVFSAGVLILVTEYLAVWSRVSREIAEQNERLGRMR